ncbi:MAG: hypothetical protein K6E92_06945 [Lachnospiraceae bacterium]|nr:hypothetical protein [Lachnospiraceae bacterium]
MKRIGCGRDPEGYLTVEAALVLPIVLSVIILVICLWFFQTDRLLLEADVARACIRSAGERGLSKEDRVLLAGAMAEGEGQGRYLAWSGNRVRAVMENGKLTVTGEGSVGFPIPGFGLPGGNGTLHASVSRTRSVRSEVLILRMGRRATGAAAAGLSSQDP